MLNVPCSAPPNIIRQLQSSECSNNLRLATARLVLEPNTGAALRLFAFQTQIQAQGSNIIRGGHSKQN